MGMHLYLENFASSNVQSDYSTLGWGFNGISGVNVAAPDPVFGGRSSNGVSFPYSLQGVAFPHGASPTAFAGARFNLFAAASVAIEFMPTLEQSNSGPPAVDNRAQVNVAASLVGNTASIFVYNNAAQIGTVTNVPVPGGGIVYLAALATFSPTEGSVEVFVGSDSVLTLTNVNTDGFGTGNAVAVIFSAANQTTMTDVQVGSGTDGSLTGPLLDPTVLYIAPNGNSGAPQFAANGHAEQWQNDASVPPSAANYNSSVTIGQADQTTLAPLPGNVETIMAAILRANAVGPSSGTHTFTQEITSSGTVSTGPSHLLSGVPAYYEAEALVDPATGVAWTVAGLNAAIRGYTLTK
jgi:hypothetical protein